MRRLVLVVALLAGGLVGWLASPRGAPPAEEEQIRETLELARQAAEARNAGRFMRYISTRYDDGHYQYETLRGMLSFGLREYTQVRVILYVRDIQVKGATATAELEVQAEGTDPSGNRARFEDMMRVEFVRERARRRLFFKESRWRALSTDSIGDLQDAFVQ
ncbi:MAG TPA: hypothetical protein GX715_17775 [Armatimonadetes bacterium]|nr:hypothetical protein [Armatimonadota bacterium]